jgi:hypothetical protein
LTGSHDKEKINALAKAEVCKKIMKELDKKEDATYDDMKLGLLDETQYQRRILRIREERDENTKQFEHLVLLKSDSGEAALDKMFELATRMKLLWKDMDRQERVELLKKVCSNPTLDALTVEYQLRKPFKRLASWGQNSKWRRERDSTHVFLTRRCETGTTSFR